MLLEQVGLCKGLAARPAAVAVLGMGGHVDDQRELGGVAARAGGAPVPQPAVLCGRAQDAAQVSILTIRLGANLQSAGSGSGC